MVIGGSGTGTYNGYLFEGNWFDQGWIAMAAMAEILLPTYIMRNNIFIMHA